jgi:hypothetical protein
MLISQHIFNSQITVPMIGAVICAFSVRSGPDNFVDGSGHGGTRLFWNSRLVQLPFHYSCGPGHARLRHFLLDGSMRHFTEFFTFLIQHKSDYDIEIDATLSHFAQFSLVFRGDEEI